MGRASAERGLRFTADGRAATASRDDAAREEQRSVLVAGPHGVRRRRRIAVKRAPHPGVERATRERDAGERERCNARAHGSSREAHSA